MRVLELGFSAEPPAWLLAGAWTSKAAQGLANAAVWAAPFLRKQRPVANEVALKHLLDGESGTSVTSE